MPTPLKPVPEGHKWCYYKQHSSPIENFPIDRSNKSTGRAGRCKDCDKEIMAGRRASGVTKQVNQRARRKVLYAKYGWTILDYEIQHELQQGLCAICHQSQRPRVKHRLSIDYDSVGKRVRGLLCASCKRQVSMFEKWPKNIYERPDHPATLYILNPPTWEAGD